MEKLIDILLYVVLFGGVAVIFYWFYKILYGGFTALKNDDD
jgi:hypothetical protein